MGKALLEVIVFANYKWPSRMISSMRCTVIMHAEITDFVSSQYFLFQSDFKGWLRRKIMSLINMVIIAVHQIKMVNFCSYWWKSLSILIQYPVSILLTMQLLYLTQLAHMLL